MRTVYVVVPDGIDDPAHPSGGNAYDRRICAGLGTSGWSVVERPVPGDWPTPDAAAAAGLAAAVALVPDGALLVVDGLIGSAAAAVLVPHATRLRLVMLVHQPLVESWTHAGSARRLGSGVAAGEGAVLRAAAAVIATSEWSRSRLLARYDLAPPMVTVAEPGVDEAGVVRGTAAGTQLLSVGAVTGQKGHDVLVAALGGLADLDWRCACVGALDVDPRFVAELRRRAEAAGIAGRVEFPGPLVGAALDRRYAATDVLLVASRAEAYGMVVTEALARGIPVITTDVGGLADTLGRAPDGGRPGLLVPADDPGALGGAVGRWLRDGELRARLRSTAALRRPMLAAWSVTTQRISQVLSAVAAVAA